MSNEDLPTMDNVANGLFKVSEEDEAHQNRNKNESPEITMFEAGNKSSRSPEGMRSNPSNQDL